MNCVRNRLHPGSFVCNQLEKVVSLSYSCFSTTGILKTRSILLCDIVPFLL